MAVKTKTIASINEIKTLYNRLERFKNKRNEYIHNLLSQDIGNIEKGTKEIYEGNKLLLGDFIDKFEKKLKKAKK